MSKELQRLINNLNEVTVKGKANLLIISDAITTLEQLLLKEQASEQAEDA